MAEFTPRHIFKYTQPLKFLKTSKEEKMLCPTSLNSLYPFPTHISYYWDTLSNILN